MSHDSDKYFLDLEKVRQSFDRAAHEYEGAAILQQEIGDRLMERLDVIGKQPMRIIDAGCGSGHFTRELLQRYPGSRVLALDIAGAMLEVARQQCEGFEFFDRLCADISDLPLQDNSVDLVFCNLVIQWCNDPDRVFSEFARVLSPDGWLLFSTFGPDTLRELRSAWQRADDYSHVNRFIDMHDLGDALVRVGFREPVMDAEHITMVYDTVRGVMQDLKAIGAHNLTAGRPRGLTGKDRFARMQQEYESFRKEGRLPATYEVIYGSAWMSTQGGTSADGEFSLEEMQRVLRRHAAK